MSLHRAIEGSSLGRYHLLERLAVGGMAEVFLALELGAHDVERLVVIKAILPQHDKDQGFLDMFRQEARLAARIQHPNVVQLFELSEIAGHPFIAMEYVPGLAIYDLQRAAAGTALPVGVAIRLIVQACTGAHAAHELRDLDGRPLDIVHRDLTPHNLLVTAQGHLKILDFGIAKASMPLQAETRTGVLKGKFPYMSPEQVREEPLDRRSDLFTLGVVLYEMLTGTALFQRTSDISTIQAVLSHAVLPVQQVRSDLPPKVAAVVDRALAPRREDRFDTCERFAKALLDAAASEGVDTRQERVQGLVSQLLGERLVERERAVASAVTVFKARRRAQEEEAAFQRAHALRLAALEASRRRWRWGLGIAASALAVGAVVVGSAVGGVVWWRVRTPETTGPVLRIAVTPSLGADTLLAEMAPLDRALEIATGRPIEFVAGSSYDDTAARLLDGSVGYAFLAPYLYVATAARSKAVRPLAVKVIDGGTGSDGVLLVSDASGINAVGDTRGHTICYTDRSSATGWLLPRATLRLGGVDPDHDVAASIMSGNHLQLIRDVASGKCEVGGTYTAAMLSADGAGVQVAKTRVLTVTGRTPNDVLVRGPSADDASAAVLQKAFLAFDPERDLGTSRVGEIERISGFAPADDHAFDDVRRAVDSERMLATP